MQFHRPKPTNLSFESIKAVALKQIRSIYVLLPFLLGILLLPTAQILQGFLQAPTATFVSSTPSSLGASPVDFLHMPFLATQIFMNEHGMLKVELTFKDNITESQQSPISGPTDNIINPITLSKRIGRLEVKLLPFISLSEHFEIQETGWAFRRFGWKGIIRLEFQSGSLGKIRGWFELEQLTADAFFDGDRIIYRSKSDMFTAKLSEIKMRELRKEEQYGSCKGVAIMPRTEGPPDSKMFAFFYGCAS